MKPSIQEKIKTTETLIRICNIVSIVAIIFTLLLFLAEFCIAKFVETADWKVTVLRTCNYILFVMPFAVVVPLFFRVNLKGKLYQLSKEQKENKA